MHRPTAHQELNDLATVFDRLASELRETAALMKSKGADVVSIEAHKLFNTYRKDVPRTTTTVCDAIKTKVKLGEFKAGELERAESEAVQMKASRRKAKPEK